VLSIFCGVFPASVHAYSGGDGSAGNPFQISTVADLEQLRTDADNGATAGKYYKLMNDIDLSGINPWNPIGYSNPFEGNFDGNYHVISHVTIGTAGSPEPSLFYVGLFGKNSGTISRLGVTDVSIYSSSSADTKIGGLAGLNSGTIANCYATGSVTGGNAGKGFNIFVGGLVGFNDTDAPIENCYSTASATVGTSDDENSSVFAGGLGGYVLGSYATNYYATGGVAGGGYFFVHVGGVGGGGSSDVTYSYWNSDAAQTKGGVTQDPKRGYGTDPDTAIPKTSAEMKSQDFVDLLNEHRGAHSGWLIVPGKNDGYPILGCTVTFDSNGGSAVDEVITDRDTTISEPSEPTKAGCTFDGWYKDAGLTTPWNFATDTVT
ncbi:MAG: InlB B-repeat-containing protein, partial [Chloroflexi bacterium]|nr:InlB B-repeat-containing protein [Chloroflexota bacterium]